MLCKDVSLVAGLHKPFPPDACPQGKYLEGSPVQVSPVFGTGRLSYQNRQCSFDSFIVTIDGVLERRALTSYPRTTNVRDSL